MNGWTMYSAIAARKRNMQSWCAYTLLTAIRSVGY